MNHPNLAIPIYDWSKLLTGTFQETAVPSRLMSCKQVGENF
jgi:hypothetical protein